MSKKTEIEKQILDILNADADIANLAGYLLRIGAGTVFPGDMSGGEKFKIIGDEKQLIAWELSGALNDPLEGEWETEIGRLILAKNVKKMRETAQQLHGQNPRCPYCRWNSKVIHRKKKNDYRCCNPRCQKSWKF